MAPTTDAFAQAPPSGGAETGGFNPNMFGDQLGHGQVSSSSNRIGALATVVRGAYKITENESPAPQDRVFFTYNYYNNVNGSQNPPGTPQSDVHREMIGVEKTILGGNASIGLRLPYIEITGNSEFQRSDVGDLTLLLKYALINDPSTHNVLSGGLVVTFPTGGNFLPAGVTDVHSTLLQPYVGGIYNMGSLFLQGFSSFVVPTDSRDVTAWNNDLAVGYWLYRSCDHDRLLTYIVPTVELHISTPTNHRGSDSTPVGGIDLFDVTAAVTLGLGDCSALGLAVVTPFSGPRPYDVEAQCYFNWRF
jgi:hypothetical protein